MLRVVELKKGGKKGAGNIAKYLAEYYHQDQEILPPGEWIGASADALGLNDPGRDLKKDIEALIQGKDPNGPGRLTKSRGKRFGYDLTFSDEKYVSVLAATASPELRKAIIDAHTEAVKETLAVGLPLVVGRWGKDGKYRAEADVPVRLVHHMDSRAGDPNLHTHTLLPNVCRVGDKWLTIDAKEVMTAQKALGAIFREKMAQKIEAMGFTVEQRREVGQGERATGEVWHSVAGMPDEVLKQFSKRDEEIARVAEAEGIGRDLAAKKTRQHKTEQNSARAVIENAQTWLKDAGIELQADSLKGMAREREAFTPRTRAEVLESLHAHESAFGVWDFVAAEAKEGRVYTSKDQALGALIDGRDCLRLDDDRFISRAQYELEAGITRAALARKHETTHRLDPEAVAAAIDEHEVKNGFQLSADQRAAVEHVCSGGGVSLIVGRAGTGKTATAGAYMGAFEAAGYDVVSVSTATKAASNLQRETGREARNFAQIVHALDEGKTRLTDRSVVVIEEAGMVSAKDFAAVQKHADKAGAKIIAIGDEKQLQPVGAGSPFRDLLAELEASTLDKIRRQKQEAARRIAGDFYDGKAGTQIVAAWEAKGMLTTHDDRPQAVAALVEDYSKNPAPAANKLVITHTHADSAAINNAVRADRKAAGDLGEERAVNVWAGGGKEQTQTPFAVGDRIRFTANERAKVKQYVNGEAGEVVGWGQDTIKIRVESDEPKRNGQIVELGTNGKPLDIAHGYAQVLAVAQGLGAESVYYLPSQNIDRNTALVGHTRTKEAFHMYAAEDERESIAEGVDNWRFKDGALELVAAAGVAVGVEDAHAQQAHERRQEHQRQQEQERAADPATWKAAEEHLGKVAAETWREAAQRPQGTDWADIPTIGAVRDAADALLPPPPIDPVRLREAEARAGIPDQEDDAQKAKEAAEKALEAMKAAGDVIRPVLEQAKDLKDRAEKTRAAAERAKESADWRTEQILGAQDTAKDKAKVMRVIKGEEWGLFDFPKKSLKAAIGAVRKDRAAQERREERARVADEKREALMEQWKPEIDAYKAAKQAAESTALEGDEQQEAVKRARDKVAADMPERQQHEARVRKVVAAAVKAAGEPWRQQQREDRRQAAEAKQRRAVEQAAQETQRAAYEREHAHERSRGMGMSM